MEFWRPECMIVNSSSDDFLGTGKRISRTSMMIAPQNVIYKLSNLRYNSDTLKVIISLVL